MRRTDRLQHTRHAILDAAAATFAEQGIQGANLDEIAARAGVSKPTVYAHFGSKEGLCEALLTARTEQAQGEARLRFDPEDDPQEVLTTFAVAHTRVVLDPAQLGLLRAFFSELIHRPDWGEQLTARLGDKGLGPYLRQAHAAGVLRVPDPEAAASLFWAAVKGVGFFPYLVGLAGPRTPAQHAADVREAVGLFLARFAPAP